MSEKSKKLNKAWFYKHIKRFNNSLPIYINIPLNEDNPRYRIIYSWSHRKPNGDFNPIMSCQLIDTTKQGRYKYVVPDLIFDCVKMGITSDYTLYKHLSSWIDNALKEYKE